MQNLNFVALAVPEITGGTRKKFGQSLNTPTLPFLQFFNGMDLFRWTLLLFWPILKFVALPFPEIITIGVLGGVANPNLGEEEVVGAHGWYHWKEHW